MPDEEHAILIPKQTSNTENAPKIRKTYTTQSERVDWCRLTSSTRNPAVTESIAIIYGLDNVPA